MFTSKDMFELGDLSAEPVYNVEHVEQEVRRKDPFDPKENFESESDIAERCFKEKYPGHSREWLIRDASAKLPRAPPSSTMKDTYSWPYPREERPKIGRVLDKVVGF